MRKSTKYAAIFLLSLALLLGSIPPAAYAEEIAEQTQIETAAEEEEITVDLSDHILQAGGFNQDQSVSSNRPKFAAAKKAVSDREGLIELLYQTVKNWDGTSTFVPIYLNDVVCLLEDLDSIFSQFINGHPELYYVSSWYSFSYSDDIVERVTLYFDPEKYDPDKVSAFETITSGILSQVKSSWSDEQKALFLHDYIVTHCEYDLTYSNYSAYDVLVTGSSVCQGYALAYYYLLTQCGIEADVITSVELNHAWNQVTIDGQKYYVDCTWDDPVADESSVLYQDYCRHTNFLRSQTGIIGTGHDSEDWVGMNGTVYDTASGSEYEEAWWDDTISAIPCVENLWAYVSDEDSAVYVYDYVSGSSRKLAEIGFYWPFIHLAAYGKYFYASTDDKIYQIGTDGEIKIFYELSEEELEEGSIYGIRIEDEYLYYRLYTGYDSGSFVEEKWIKLSEYEIAVQPTWIRLAGNGRYDTMSEIVNEGFSSIGGTVVVATGTGFKDALAAAGLAGLYDAPAILTDGKVLSHQAQEQLERLQPSQVFIAGGEAAVSKNVFNSIQTITGAQPVRLFGQTSAGTSAALATAGSGWSDTAIIATNKTFKDALSAAPVSYSLHMPILLADNGKSLNADVLSALKKCGIKKVIIVGGKLAVTENVEKQLVKNDISKNNISRIAGNTAVDTSAQIAEFGLSHGLTINGMGVATSQNYPDALAGAALCGHNNSVLLLADDKAMKNTSFPTKYKADFVIGYVFGGTIAVSDTVMKALQAAVK